MALTKKLFWMKYRPKNIDGMILLPRIKKMVTNRETGEIELPGNILLVGTPGTGKSALSEIIVPKGALRVNASSDSGIDDLRGDVTDYCRTADIFSDNTLNGYKMVYLDEFDGVSAKYQEALRGFIEEYEDRIRFVATCNNISKISGPLLSRFNRIDFDPKTADEVNYLKEQYMERAQLVRDKNNIQVSDGELQGIINSTFPDLRSVMNALQVLGHVGGSDKVVTESTNMDLYNILFGKIQPDVTYAWVMENFGDKIDGLIKMCGRPLAQYIFQYKPEHSMKVRAIMETVTYHSNNLANSIDPFVLALSMIYKIQDILQK
jgi:replication-associated recombination protein RarA